MKKPLSLLLLAVLAIVVGACTNPAGGPGTGGTVIPNPNDPEDPNIPGGPVARPALPSPTAVDRWNGTPQIINSTGGYFGSVLRVSRNGTAIVVSDSRDDRDSSANLEEGTFIYGPVTVLRAVGSGWDRFVLWPEGTGRTLSQIDFGSGLDISDDGNFVAIGARRDHLTVDPLSISSGAVYLYAWTGSGYTQRARITPNETQSNLHFGHSVAFALNGRFLAVGAPKYDLDDNYANRNGISTGRVYALYSEDDWVTWTETTLDAQNPPPAGMKFIGYSVAVSADGTRIVAGARGDSGDGTEDEPIVANAGSAYLFEGNPAAGTWTQSRKLLASDRETRGSTSGNPQGAHDGYGHSVSISADGNTILIGAYRDDPKGNASGSVYLYTRAGAEWQERRLYSVHGERNDQLGYATALSDDGNVAVAGYGMADGTATYGRVSVFSSPGEHENILWSPPRNPGDFFGRAVDVSGDGNMIVVGEPSLRNVSRPGRVLIFR